MSDHSAIEWTDATWPVVTGCEHISSGCDHCYAAKLTSGRLRNHPAYAGLAVGGRFTGQVRTLADRLTWPLTWRKPRKIFVSDMADLFHSAVPDEFIAAVFAVMIAAPHHTFQVLTKRHGRMRALLTSHDFALTAHKLAISRYGTSVQAGWPLPNVWVGVSVEAQRWADVRIPALVKTPAAVRFISAEPLLGPVDLSRWLRPVPDCGYVGAEDGTCIHPTTHTPECHRWADCPVRSHEADWFGIDWVIAGGESGPRARPMHPGWARSLRDQCEAIGEPFFFKQLGEYTPYVPTVPDTSRPDGSAPDWDHPAIWVDQATGRTVDREADVPDTGSWQAVYRVGKKAAGRQLDGRLHHEFPAGSAR